MTGENVRFGAGFRLACVLTLLFFAVAARAGSEGNVAPLPVDAGPGSSAPRLSSDSAGTIVLSWLEPRGDGVSLRFSVLGNDGWEPPGTVARGDNWFVNWADFPSVAPIAGSLWAAHWLSMRPGGVYSYDVSIAVSRDAGESWSDPITPHRDGTATEHGFVSLFPWQGGVGAIWLDGRNMQPEKSEHGHAEGGGMTLRSAVIDAENGIGSETEMDGLVCDCCQTDVAVALEGPVAVYRDRTVSEVRDIHVARSVGGQWRPGLPVAEDGWVIAGCPVNGPAIAARGDDVAVAWFTMAKDRSRVRFARSVDGARTFGDALDIDTGSPMGRVDVAFLGNGDAAVSWLHGNAGEQGEIRVQIVTSAGRLAQQYVIAQTATTRPAGFPQMTADGNSLILAWTDVSQGQTRVRTARIRM